MLRSSWLLAQARSQQTTADHKRPDQSRPEQTTANHNRPDQSRPDQSRADQSRADQTSRPEQTTPEQTRADQSRPEQTRADQNRPDQNKPDQSRPDCTAAQQHSSTAAVKERIEFCIEWSAGNCCGGAGCWCKLDGSSGRGNAKMNSTLNLFVSKEKLNLFL